MTRRLTEGFSWRPTVHDELLIDLCIGSRTSRPTDVLALWETWARGLSRPLGALEGGTARLLPLAAWRVRAVAGHLDSTDITNGIALRRALATSSVDSQHTLLANERLICSLKAFGIDVIVLKGTALRATIYPAPATRPVSDLDVLIDPSMLDAARVWVAANGGTLGYATIPTARSRAFRHAADTTVLDGTIDLHWRLLADSFDERLDEALRTRVVQFEIGSTTTTTLSPEDHLLHAIAHGMWTNPLSPIRWVVDAALLLETHPIDWSIVLGEASARRLSDRMHVALSYLRERFGVPVPIPVLDALMKRSSCGASPFPLTGMRWSKTGYGRAFDLLVARYVHGSTSWPLTRRVSMYPSYARFVVSATSRRDG